MKKDSAEKIYDVEKAILEILKENPNLVKKVIEQNQEKTIHPKLGSVVKFELKQPEKIGATGVLEKIVPVKENPNRVFYEIKIMEDQGKFLKDEIIFVFPDEII